MATLENAEQFSVEDFADFRQYAQDFDDETLLDAFVSQVLVGDDEGYCVTQLRQELQWRHKRMRTCPIQARTGSHRFSLAPRVGFEPTTYGLTVRCATTAPPGNKALRKKE